MLTLKTIKSEFSDLTECYQNEEQFEGHGDFCDVYFVAEKKEVKQSQVDVYNSFKQNFKSYLPKIEDKIKNSLTHYESNKADEIRNATLYFDVIQVPQDNPKYDLVLICSKYYKKFLFLKQTITLRVEFKNGTIVSIKRTSDSTKDNEA